MASLRGFFPGEDPGGVPPSMISRELSLLMER
jgi:hypothetical protein